MFCVLKLACLFRFSFPLGNPACVDVAHVVDGSGVSHGNTNPSAAVMPPPKRSKLYALFSFAIVKVYIVVIRYQLGFNISYPVSYLHCPSLFS